jgi:hypothetical protein
MTKIFWAALLAPAVLAAAAPAADPGPAPPAPRKEPNYQSKAPRYGLLVFGPEAQQRVWLVHDGDVLYVDKNGDGDLTDPGAKVTAKSDPGRDPNEPSYYFEVGDLAVNGRVHKGLAVSAVPVTRYGDAVRSQPNARAALAADPKAQAYVVSLDVERPGLRGQGAGGRVVQMAGVLDGNGVLLFAGKPADAPVIHFDGPLQVAFYGEKPALKLGRDNDVVLVVGTPGRGPGTFAMLAYEETVPRAADPTVEVVFPAAREGDPPVRQRYELKQRC